MLIALLAAYFFSSGGFDFGEFMVDTQDRMQLIVSDASRRDEALEVTRQILSSTQRYRDERINLLQNSEANLIVNQGLQSEVLLDLFDKIDEQNARHIKTVVDLRFELTQSLTAQEWADLFQ